MDINLFFYLTLGVAGMLMEKVFKLSSKVRKLQILLAEERHKLNFPLLAFSVNRDEMKAILKNESYCYAKNIKINDVDLIVDYGFKKTLKLRFEPIPMLRPNQQTTLSYKVFDNNFDVTPQSPDSLVLQFRNSPFNMVLQFENLEDKKFISNLAWKENQYVVKDVLPLEASIA